MDVLSLLRTLGGLGIVLGILAGVLWLVRRYDIRLPGRRIGASERRLELIETLPIDARRTVALVRRDGREHLVLIAPEGHLSLESGVIRESIDDAVPDDAPAEARRQKRQGSARTQVSDDFAALVDTVQARKVPAAQALKAALERAYPSPAKPSRARAVPEPIAQPARRRLQPLPVAAPEPIARPARKRPPHIAIPAPEPIARPARAPRLAIVVPQPVANPARRRPPVAAAAPEPVARPARKRPPLVVVAPPIAQPARRRPPPLAVAAPDPAPKPARKRLPPPVAAPQLVAKAPQRRRSASSENPRHA